MTMSTSLEAMRSKAGQQIGVSSWISVDQSMIDPFADVTGDAQWIHVDVERARRESPFGSTVAHGYLTLSLIAGLAYEISGFSEGVETSINYGLDKVRFLTPVRAGSRIRLRMSLVSIEDKGPLQHLVKSLATVEIEGEQRPALVAETLVLLIMKET